MSKEVLEKQVGEWRKEVARLKDLIAHATGTEAAANKATEEGELHHRLDATAIRSASFAADRASRQVANKAEVEPSDSYKSGYADGMDEGAKLALWGDKPSEKFPEGWPSEIWLNAGDDELGPFSEYDELSWCSAPQGESDVRYIREDLLATPPATTGASTARDEILEEAAAAIDALNDSSGDAAAYDHREQYPHEVEREFAIEVCAKTIRELKSRTPVGASTVLTDERIKAIFKELGVAGEPMPNTYKFARAIEREVAAQAGQVAVPEKLVADIDAIADELEAEAMNYEGDFADTVHGCAQALRIIIAPSPAKESK